MSEPKLETNLYQAMLEGLYLQIAQDAFQKVRAKAWDQFLEIGLPSRKSEAFRYLKLRSLFAQSYSRSRPSVLSLDRLKNYIFDECKKSVLVFVNGHFQPTLSNLESLPKKVQICSLNEAVGTYGGFLNNHWAKTLKEETDPFAALNTALHENGVFVYLPPKTVVETPIQILQITDTEESPMLVVPRTHIFLGARSEAKFYVTHQVLSGTHYCMNKFVDLFLDEDAHAHYTQVIMDASEQSWHFDAVRGHLKRNSGLKTVALTNGSATVRTDYRISLNGENAEALLNGIAMLNDKREAHTHILMDHQAPHCHSFQLFKNVLNDFSKSSFEGKILVKQAAQKTDAFQLNNNLLLSDRAHADSKPNLEIFADDVKASHGATFGQLDAEQLFFMRSRGISPSDAKNMLIFSFFKDVIDLVTLPSLNAQLSQKAQNYLKKR